MRDYIGIGVLMSIGLALSLHANASNNTNSMHRLATSTSTTNSGLKVYLLPEFTKDTGTDVQVIAAGTDEIRDDKTMLPSRVYGFSSYQKLHAK